MAYIGLGPRSKPSPVADVCKPIISTSNVDCLEGLKPIKANKTSIKHKQPRGLKLSNKRKGPRNKHSMVPSANAMKNGSQEKAVKLEVEKQLGIHSDDTDLAMIQCIAEMDD
ncbi:hypothetical protein Ancab_009710 [Ancistrocladus abbreviatus]